MKNFNNLSNTEKIFTIFASLLILVVLFGALSTTKSIYLPAKAQEGSVSSEESTASEDEASTEEESTVSEDEVSVETVSTPSVEEISTPSVEEVSTVSTPSVDEPSVASQDDEEEVSTPSEPSVASEPSVEEQSVRSGSNIEDVEDYISLSDDVAVVFEDERLFFLVPVKVKKTLLLDEGGTVVDVQQTLLNRILGILSF